MQFDADKFEKGRQQDGCSTSRAWIAGAPLLLLVLLLTAAGARAQEPAASYRDVTLTADDFERTYFRFWQTRGEPDSPAFRAHFARHLVEQELIARRGRAAGLDRTDAFQARLRGDRDFFARRRYLERAVRDSVPVPTPAEVDAALRAAGTSFRVRQLFARSRAEAEALRRRVERGEPFAQVARETVPDAAVAARGGDLGWIPWGELDLPAERVLLALEPGQVSEPVESLMGWHVFRLDSLRHTARIGPVHPKERREMRERLHGRRFDMAAAHHLRALVWSRELIVDMDVVARAWAALAPRLPRSGAERARRPLLDVEVPDADLADAVIATVDGEPFTVAQFFEAVPSLPRADLRPNLKKAVEIAVRDRLLTEAALAASFGEDPVVVEKTRRAEITMLYFETLAAAYDTLTGAVPDLEAFYHRHRERYATGRATEVWQLTVTDPDTARALAARLHAGTPFEHLAARHGGGGDGYRGFVAEDAGAVGRRAARLTEGAVYAPVPVPGGHAVIRAGRSRQQVPPLEAVRDRVRADARAHVQEELHRALLPADYDPAEVVVHTEHLARAFTGATTY